MIDRGVDAGAGAMTKQLFNPRSVLASFKQGPDNCCFCIGPRLGSRAVRIYAPRTRLPPPRPQRPSFLVRRRGHHTRPTRSTLLNDNSLVQYKDLCVEGQCDHSIALRSVEESTAPSQTADIYQDKWLAVLYNGRLCYTIEM